MGRVNKTCQTWTQRLNLKRFGQPITLSDVSSFAYTWESTDSTWLYVQQFHNIKQTINMPRNFTKVTFHTNNVLKHECKYYHFHIHYHNKLHTPGWYFISWILDFAILARKYFTGVISQVNMKKGHSILQFKSCELLSVLLLGYTLSQYVHVLCNNISKHQLNIA